MTATSLVFRSSNRPATRPVKLDGLPACPDIVAGGKTSVKASAVDYVRAASVADAIAMLGQHGDGAKLIAGGQSLVPALNLRLSAPALLIDIFRLPELQGVTLQGGALRLGAGCTHAQLLADPLVAEHAPLIARALADVAHPAIRSRGTIGGSLANADPAAELPACALALGATMLLQGSARHAPGRGRTSSSPACSTRRCARTRSWWPSRFHWRPAARWGFAELARRSGDYAMVGLARAADVRPATRLAFFSAGSTAVLARRAAAALAPGITAATVQAASDALADDLPPHADLQASAATRLHLARVLLRRVVDPLGSRHDHDPAAGERRGRRRRRAGPGAPGRLPARPARPDRHPSRLRARRLRRLHRPARRRHRAGLPGAGGAGRWRHRRDDRGPVGQRRDRRPAGRLHPAATRCNAATARPAC